MATVVNSMIGLAAILPLLQDGGAPPSSAPAPETKPASAPAASLPASAPARANQPAAVKFLTDAAAARAPKGEPMIDNATIRFFAETNGEQHNEFRAEHLFLRPNRIRTHITTDSAEVERGFDGTSYWLRSQGATQRIDDRQHKKDRDEIDASIRVTENILRLTSLENLSRQMTGLELLADGARPGVRGRLEKYLTLHGESAAAADLELRFDPKTMRLAEVRAVPVGAADAPADRIVFDDYREVKDVQFPHEISAFSGASKRPDYYVSVRSVSWNDPLKPDAFDAPK